MLIVLYVGDLSDFGYDFDYSEIMSSFWILGLDDWFIILLNILHILKLLLHLQSRLYLV